MRQSENPQPQAEKNDIEEKENFNYVKDPNFLRKNNAEILVGPVPLKNCVFGHGGLVSLTSPELLNSKPRSLLLHFKGFKDKDDKETEAKASSSDDKFEINYRVSC